MKGIWFISTKHLEKQLWFRDDEDFTVGMNFVAVQLACTPEVVICAFILMSNHVHFVLASEREDAERFIYGYMQRYSTYFKRKWGIKSLLHRKGVDIRQIPYENEAVERAVAYVQMNCVAANICSNPTQYSWGTGNSFFNATQLSGKPLKSYSERARERILHSNCKYVPLNWNISPEGFIDPREYVDVRSVEALFRTPSRMGFFLNTSSKARKRIEVEGNLPAFRDQTILVAAPELLKSLYHRASFQELTEVEQAEFMRQIRFRFSADVNQIARVCGLSYAEAARIIDLA